MHNFPTKPQDLIAANQPTDQPTNQPANSSTQEITFLMKYFRAYIIKWRKDVHLIQTNGVHGSHLVFYFRCLSWSREQDTNTGYKYRIQIQDTNTGCKYRIQIQDTNTGCRVLSSSGHFDPTAWNSTSPVELPVANSNRKRRPTVTWSLDSLFRLVDASERADTVEFLAHGWMDGLMNEWMDR